MVRVRVLDIHRRWQDWFGIALGVLVALSPLLTGHIENQLVLWGTIAVGVWVAQFAGLQLVDLERSEEIGLLICGLWLLVSPFALGYADGGTLMVWHFALGAAVVFLALLALWQDWRLNDQELVQHGL
jgi:O-antigen/teichoic acid export membrane protein